MKKQKKIQHEAPIEPPDNRKKRHTHKKPTVKQIKNDKRFCLYVICSYLILVVLTWVFFSCPEAVKITMCLLIGLIINLILIIIDIREIWEIEFIVKYTKLFAIIIGLIFVLITYFYAFRFPFIKDFYMPFKCRCECNCIEIPLKLIPSGVYKIGISVNEENKIINIFPNMGVHLNDEKPQHSVSLESFLISEYEITNEIYSCFAKDKKLNFTYKRVDKFKPINNISWYEANDFCKWLSKKIDRKIDLPTEAQWEVAAGTYIFPWGDDYPQINTVNFNSTYNGTTPVDSIKNYSSFEVINMAGNVAEWCLDYYGDYTNCPNTRNPQGPSTGTKRVVRGGSWRDNAFDVRVSKRNSYPANTKINKIGFRIVINNHLNNGGNNYANQIFQFRDSRNAVIIINGM